MRNPSSNAADNDANRAHIRAAATTATTATAEVATALEQPSASRSVTQPTTLSITPRTLVTSGGVFAPAESVVTAVAAAPPLVPGMPSGPTNWTAGAGCARAPRSEYVAAYLSHVPRLPDRRVSTLSSSDWRRLCDGWPDDAEEDDADDAEGDGRVEEAPSRTTRAGSSGARNAPPPRVERVEATSGSHGLGDWHMSLTHAAFEARIRGSALRVDWPALSRVMELGTLRATTGRGDDAAARDKGNDGGHAPPPQSSESPSVVPFCDCADPSCARRMLAQMPYAFAQPFALDTRDPSASLSGAALVARCRRAEDLLRAGARDACTAGACASRRLLPQPTPSTAAAIRMALATSVASGGANGGDVSTAEVATAPCGGGSGAAVAAHTPRPRIGDGAGSGRGGRRERRLYDTGAPYITAGPLVDPHALTIAIHVRTGAADVPPRLWRDAAAAEDGDEMDDDSSAPSDDATTVARDHGGRNAGEEGSGGVSASARRDARPDDELASSAALMHAERPLLLREAIACAESLEALWLGTRHRSVWLIVSDDASFASDLRRRLARRRGLIRGDGGGRTGPVARVLVVPGARDGALHANAHTGPMLHRRDDGEEGVWRLRNAELPADENATSYESALSRAWRDWLLLSECDFLLAISGNVVSEVSAYARTAAVRGVRINSTYVRKPARKRYHHRAAAACAQDGPTPMWRTRTQVEAPSGKGW